jgi:glycosyltransferase involved in cell wall biosynthesis
MTETRLKILFLPRWYPNRYDPMPGLFVKRQAEAVSLFCDVAVLYVHKDANCPNKYEVDFAEEEQLIVVRVYYKVASRKIPVVGSLLQLFRFFKAYRLGFEILNTFQPDLIHVHVLTRVGFIALLKKIVNKIPFVVSEHWSRYFVENGTYKGFWRKQITRCIVRNSLAVIAVSGKLKEAMLNYRLKNQKYFIVPNVVDMDRFTLAEKEHSGSKKQIIHVSCFEDKSKNITGFLRVIKNVSQKRSDFEVKLVGDGPDFTTCTEVAKELGLEHSMVTFTGQKSVTDLAELMANADFLVLSSNYETFGTVVIESLACGTPVVATNVGIVPEVINESNGIIVPPGNIAALEEAIISMLTKSDSFDQATIRKAVSKEYNHETIGMKLFEIYSEILDSVKPNV